MTSVVTAAVRREVILAPSDFSASVSSLSSVRAKVS